MEEHLIAPCGMNCALCVSYLAMQNHLKEQGFNKKYCPGCLPRGKHCVHMQAHCDLVGKGLVRFCFECEDFPCSRLKTLDQRYRTKYHMSMIANLEYIKEFGIQKFLQKQESEWLCPECGGVICCHNGLCLNCDLDTLRHHKKYRWGEQ
jgi:hypothetical protein